MRAVVLKRMAKGSWKTIAIALGTFTFLELARQLVSTGFAVASFGCAIVAYCIYTGYSWCASDIDAEQERMLKDIKND
jgi:hypothetical protein|tara:strand:- start:732 stop:965 length:234 start_codon:yes stop_codon:yes gene_type:complete